jgi:hypothetical protein
VKLASLNLSYAALQVLLCVVVAIGVGGFAVLLAVDAELYVSGGNFSRNAVITRYGAAVDAAKASICSGG